jgi:hypothetical protein
MGILDFLKKKQTESVRFSELVDWLNRQVEGKHLDRRISATKQEMNSLLEDARKHLDLLEKAELQNDKIPLKEKQIMEGHRKTYLQRVRRFLDEITVPDDFAQVGHYTARFSESLSHLGQETLKNFSILKQFFDIEVSRVAQILKGMEQVLSRLQSEIDKEGVELIKEAKIRIKQYNDDLNKKARLEQELENHNQELDVLKKKREKIESRLQEFKKSAEYLQFKEFIDEKKKTEGLANTVDQDIITIFAELNRPLKKYTHNTINEKIADQYIADPVGALEEDTPLLIHDLLKKMLIDIDTLELKDKQLEKTKEMIQRLSKEFLTDKKREIARLKELNKEFASKINRSIVALNIEENESWLKSLDNKIMEWGQVISKTSHDLDEINIDYLKQKAKEKVREINSSITILDDA